MNVEHLIAINFLKENSALNTGQLLMIEVSENKKKQLKIVDQSINQWLFRPANDDDTPPPIVHIIQKDETLSNILKLYAINIDSLKKWNKNGIKIEAGERIIVGYREKTNNNTIPQNEKNIKPIKKEKGIGEMIVGSNNQTGKFLALHKSIPVGTMIKIVNPENNQSIEVRIIGKIPNLDSQRDVIIKLTKSACQEIGILNERFPIQLEYLK